MNAHIVVHSQSGHTAALARSIAESLKKNGHTADVTLLRPRGRLRPRMRDVSLQRLPNLAGYDTLLCGGPVWGFAASPVALAYLKTIESLAGIRVLNFVTKSLPFRFTGGTQAVASLDKEAARAGAHILDGYVHIWRGRTKNTLESIANEICMRLTRSSDQSNRFDNL